MSTPYLMVGAGGTGSNFIRPVLAYLDSWHSQENTSWDFTIVDGDNFEAGNLTRQMFEPKYIGVNKAESLADMYSQYPVRPVAKFIGMSDLASLMEENSVTFITADNYSIRALIEQRAQELSNCVVINAGNEEHDGSVQLWVRENGENMTPRLSYLHPEIKYSGPEDRSAMSCMQVAQLPGGGQLILANMAAAQHMLSALWRYHTGVWRNGWTELQFDLLAATVEHLDMRAHRNWQLDAPKIDIGALTPETA